MTARLIGITGRARHGKNAVGEVLVRNGFVQVGFADALKEMALKLDPWVLLPPKDDQVNAWRLSWILNREGWDKAKEFPEIRRILQVLGTECVRDILGEESWIIALQKRIATMPGRSIAITDVRFPNETAAIRSWGGELWHVRRFVDRVLFDNGLDLSHPSEALVDSLDVDVEIVNNGTLEDLERKVEEILYPPIVTFHPAEKDALNENIRTLVEYRENLISRREALERLSFVKDVDAELARIEAENVPNYDSIPTMITPTYGQVHPRGTQCDQIGCKPTGGSSGPWTERELILVDVKAHPEERVPAPEDKLPLDESC